MAYPPAVLRTDQTNATPQQDAHPLDHAKANQAINDVVAHRRRPPKAADPADRRQDRVRVVPGGEHPAQLPGFRVAHIDLPAGLWLVHYDVCVFGNQAFGVSVQAVGGVSVSGTRTHQYAGAAIAPGQYAATGVRDLPLSTGPGTLAINIGLGLGPANPVNTYADPANHTIWAVGAVDY